MFTVSCGRGIGPGPRGAGRHRRGAGGRGGHRHDPGRAINPTGMNSTIVMASNRLVILASYKLTVAALTKDQ